jgi:hypothetical protein
MIAISASSHPIRAMVCCAAVFWGGASPRALSRLAIGRRYLVELDSVEAIGLAAVTGGLHRLGSNSIARTRLAWRTRRSLR